MVDRDLTDRGTVSGVRRKWLDTADDRVLRRSPPGAAPGLTLEIDVAKLTEEERARRPQLFKKGQSGNPLGASREVMLRNHENARKAARLREKFLDTLESRIATVEVLAQREAQGLGDTEADALRTQRIMALLSSDVNRLMTDSENRGFGAPKQPIEVDDQRERRVEDYSDEELLAIAAGEDSPMLPSPDDEDR